MVGEDMDELLELLENQLADASINLKYSLSYDEENDEEDTTKTTNFIIDEEDDF